jgi:hypothetical protein
MVWEKGPLAMDIAKRARSAHTIEHWDRLLTVRRRARVDGSGEHPQTSSAAPAECESDIAAAIATEAERLATRAATLGAGLERDLRRLQAAAPNFAPLTARAETEVKRVELRVAPTVSRHRHKSEEAHQEVDRFKKEHALSGPAILPNSVLLSTGFLLGLIALEAIGSAVVFADKQGAGLLTAYFLALTLSGSNAAAGFFGGFFGVRYTRHRRVVMRGLGTAAILASIAIGVGLNYAVLQWRLGDIAASPADASGPFVWLFAAPSMVLLMMAVTVFIGAMAKGAATFAADYPDLGKRERFASEREDSFDDELEDAHSAMDSAAAPARDAIEKAMQEQVDAFAAMHRTYETAATEWHDIQAAHRTLSNIWGGLVALYRQENQIHRRTPPPTSFSAAVPALPLIPDPLIAPGAVLTQAKQDLTATQNAAATASGEISASMEAALLRLRGQH